MLRSACQTVPSLTFLIDSSKETGTNNVFAFLLKEIIYSCLLSADTTTVHPLSFL